MTMLFSVDKKYLYVDHEGSFFYFNNTMDVFDECRHLFNVITYPYGNADHYKATASAITKQVGSTNSWLMILNPTE